MNIQPKREPALLYIGLLAPIVQAIAAFVFDVDPVVQGAVNALAVALAGAITTYMVKGEDLVPAATAAFQALVALVLAFGVHWSTEQQAGLMMAFGAVAAVIVRDRVVAPQPAVVDLAGQEVA
jgi:hypothetical protein